MLPSNLEIEVNGIQLRRRPWVTSNINFSWDYMNGAGNWRVLGTWSGMFKEFSPSYHSRLGQRRIADLIKFIETYEAINR